MAISDDVKQKIGKIKIGILRNTEVNDLTQILTRDHFVAQYIRAQYIRAQYMRAQVFELAAIRSPTRWR